MWKDGRDVQVFQVLFKATVQLAGGKKKKEQKGKLKKTFLQIFHAILNHFDHKISQNVRNFITARAG